MKVLECSSKGDKRFSAFYAKVDVNGKTASIEEHYQLSKRFKDNNGVHGIPQSIKDAKGKKPEHFILNGKIYDVSYLSSFYSLLWTKYLDSNPELVQYAMEFDDFTDMFRGSSWNCQADIIRKYVKQGRASVVKENREFLNLLNHPVYVTEVVGDLLYSKEDIYGHQTNCLGIMGGGIALQIKTLFPSVFNEYKSYCEQRNKGRDMMGDCLILDSGAGKLIANLFGQHGIGYSKSQTEYEHLENALRMLKKFAKENNYSIGLPYQLGSGLAGGDWEVVKDILKNVFCDYPVTIYKLPELN